MGKRAHSTAGPKQSWDPSRLLIRYKLTSPQEAAPQFPHLASRVVGGKQEAQGLTRCHLYPLPTPQVFKSRTPPEAIALCSSLLEYTPSSRLSPLEACAHSFFDELRCPGTQLPNNRPLPPLFNFSPGGENSAWDLGCWGGSQRQRRAWCGRQE